jgi:nicotinamidase-related amidase
MKQALLIIDVQKGLFVPEPQPFEAADIINKINGLTARARTTGIPVIFIQHEDATELVHASDAWQLAPELIVEPGDLTLRKTTPDSFLRTDLSQLLSEHDIDTVVICGYATEFCVDTTTRRAAALGYDVQLVEDAHTSHDKPHAPAAWIRNHHNQTLPDIGSFGSIISTIRSDQLWLS